MKNFYVLLVLPALLSPKLSHAQMYSGEYQQCNQAISTIDIIECVGKLTKKWDTRLNQAYKDLMERSNDAQKASLKTSQRLWIQYRDANCGFYADADGTISRIQASECLRHMTMQRSCEMEAANSWEGGPEPGCE